jgi:hypothetical protein
VTTYRGIPIPPDLRDTWEQHLWRSGVDAAVKRGIVRTRVATLVERLRRGELLDLTVTIRGRWFRVAAHVGAAPGSRMGLWHTDMGSWLPGGAVHGWNYRIGSLRRCLTLLAHTRPERTTR